MEAEHLQKRNNALQYNGNTVNGATADIAITTHGSDFYYAICSLMGAATIGFIAHALTKPRPARIFNYITAAVTMTATIAYFAMGSNLGFTPIDVEFHRGDHRVAGNYRSIFYARYIDWFITTPLLLLDLLLTAGMPWPTILWVIFVDWVMIVTGLLGALTQSRFKWGFYAFGCVALFYILYQLVWESRRHAASLGADIHRTFLTCGTLTAFLWLLYPIAWGVSEGGNVIAPDSEAVFYGILDFLAKPVFGALLIWGHRGIDPARLGVHIRDYDLGDVPQEKRAGTGVKGATNGTDGSAPATTTGADTSAHV